MRYKKENRVEKEGYVAAALITHRGWGAVDMGAKADELVYSVHLEKNPQNCFYFGWFMKRKPTFVFDNFDDVLECLKKYAPYYTFDDGTPPEYDIRQFYHDGWDDYYAG